MSADLNSLLAPNDDKLFEQLCQHVLEHRWKTLRGQAYGRPGQPQHGVDFYVEVPAASDAGEIIGVQCKHKDRLLEGKLGIKELEDEVKKAKRFKPALTTFIIATSAATDTKPQDKARKLNAKHQKQYPPLFSVEVWFWEKIRAEFSSARDLLREILERFYPNLITALSAPHSVLHQLPSPPANFTGRDEDLAELEKELTAAHTSGPTISGKHVGLQGMGGVGKTALATVLAHKLKDRYPGAQIYLNLRGADPEHRPPVTPADAMQNIIHAFQPEAKLPEELDQLTPVYLGVLNQAGSVLLFLDNAADGEQVKRLLPPANCLLLVTSRQHFTLPGMVARDIDCLLPEKSQVLLLKLAPRINGYEKESAELCGHLPLALEVFAGVVAINRLYSVPDLVERLLHQPAKMTRTDAAFQVSHDLLAEKLRRRWTLLAVFSGSFDLAAAAAVWDEQEDSAREAMQELVNASLVEWSQADGRLRLHDLVRAFCLGNTAPNILDTARRAHARHYTKIAEVADKLYTTKGKMADGLALFDRECVPIEAAYAWLLGHEDERATRHMLVLVDAVGYVSVLRFHPRKRIAWLESQLHAAQRLNDRKSESAALGNLGNAHRNLGNARRAIEYLEQALVIIREIGDLRSAGAAFGNLGNAHADLGDARKAIECYEQALMIARKNGDPRAEALVLVNLGCAHRNLGEVPKAIEYFGQGLAITREIGDRHGEGTALCNLGLAHNDLRNARIAIEYLERALVIARETGDRAGEGIVLANLGLARAALGEVHEAIVLFDQRIVIALEVGDRRGEGKALGNLGTAHATLGEERRAIEFFERQLVIAREIGDRSAEANALWNTAVALNSLNNRAAAISRAAAALVIYEAIEDPNAAKVRAQLAAWRGQA